MKNKQVYMRRVTRTSAFFLVIVFAAVVSSYARGDNLKVNCNGKGQTINGALKQLNPQGPNTLTVSGTCKENVVITSFDNLTLQAAPGGASINDASGGTDDVITIQDSTRITIQGFTINGGGEGVICFSQSLCRFSGNTIQGSLGDGVAISFSSAEFTSNVIQNHSNGIGLHIRGASHVRTTSDTIQGNGDIGVFVGDGSFLWAVATTVRDNVAEGVELDDHSTLRSANSTVTGNATGVFVGRASSARLMPGNVITGNNGDGVSIRDLSFAVFGPGNNISGNSGTDVACYPQFSATRGVANIAPGTTNCVEP